jgi:hypothetical protein
VLAELCWLLWEASAVAQHLSSSGLPRKESYVDSKEKHVTDNGLKIKHLEFIQSVIARMASNSFFLKAWSVTLLAGLSALAAKDAKTGYILIAFIALVTFWALDAYYLGQERAFRGLYDQVRLSDAASIDFAMKPLEGRAPERWARAFISATTICFYCPLTVLTILAAFIVK